MLLVKHWVTAAVLHKGESYKLFREHIEAFLILKDWFSVVYSIKGNWVFTVQTVLKTWPDQNIQFNVNIKITA